MTHGIRLLMVAAMLLGTTACTMTSQAWNGSVDAVFRYRDSDQSLVAYRVAEESFSFEAGLRPGDRIVTIDGQSIEGRTFEEIRGMFSGPVGTNCILEIERGGEIVELTVERRKRKDN